MRAEAIYTFRYIYVEEKAYIYALMSNVCNVINLYVDLLHFSRYLQKKIIDIKFCFFLHP